MLIPTVQSEIVCVLSNAMFCYDANPRKDLCIQVATLLVKKYRFMADRICEFVYNYVSYEGTQAKYNQSFLSTLFMQ